MDRATFDLDPAARSLAPLVEFYCPISPDWPHGASTLPVEVLQASAKAFFVQLPTYATLLDHPQLLVEILDQQRHKIQRATSSTWAFRVVLVGQGHALPAHLPHAAVQMASSPFAPEDLSDGLSAVEKAVDFQLMNLQTGGELARRIVDESYVAADIALLDVVRYEISKHHDPRRLRPAVSAILAHHRSALDATQDDGRRMDHVFTGYQTAAAVQRDDGFSTETLDHVAFFRENVGRPELAQSLRALSSRKKSVINLQLLTTDEGFAELYSFVSLELQSQGEGHFIRFTVDPDEMRGRLQRKLNEIIADSSTPYARGLALYRTLYERHGFAFCLMAKTLCEAYLRCMGNYLPLHLLGAAEPNDFPYHPVTLLERLQGFEHAAHNTCAKIAAAVSYLGMDTQSPEDCALALLRR